jgi:hypothetical protein
MNTELWWGSLLEKDQLEEQEGDGIKIQEGVSKSFRTEVKVKLSLYFS